MKEIIYCLTSSRTIGNDDDLHVLGEIHDLHMTNPARPLKRIACRATPLESSTVSATIVVVSVGFRPSAQFRYLDDPHVGTLKRGAPWDIFVASGLFAGRRQKYQFSECNYLKLTGFARTLRLFV